MKGKRFSEEQIIGVLNEAEQTGNIREVCRLHNISEQTFYRWRTKFGGMDVSEAKRLKELERENAELKKMVQRSYTTASHLTCRGDSFTNSERRLLSGFTIALLYYAHPSMLLRQLEVFNSYTPNLKNQFTLLIVDDGFPDGLQARNYITQKNYNFRIHIARIVEDIVWNIGGARNLAFFLAKTDSVLLLDLDVLVSEETVQQMVEWKMKNNNNSYLSTYRSMYL